jgi:hypothetical protein
MKTLKAMCMATILALALSVSAFGGDVSTPGAPAPGHVTNPSVEPGEVETPGKVPAAPGEIGLPSVAEVLLALVSMF